MEWREKGKDLHPGVEALGYVKMATPALLCSTKALRVVVVPSLRVSSPPRPSRARTLPTAGRPEAGAAAAASAGAEPLVSFSVLAALVAFLLVGAGAGGGGALRLRSSMGMMGGC
jgi:hypothetical protein